MIPVTRTILVFAGALACCPLSARAITVPVEPQTENPEFTVDTWTNRYDRYWREAWDGGDNRFRLKFGSNNVREWNLEEELKLAADLLPDRLRLRFWHSRLLWDSSDQRGRDTFELELRSVRRLYVSFIGSPTFTKAENAMGLVFQYRTQVDRYLKLVVELPHATRNFAERHGERPGAQYQVFTHQPVRLVVDGRGAVTERIWGRLTVDFVPSFETAMEDDDTGRRWAHEKGEAVSAGGWLEYASGERALGLNRPPEDISPCRSSPRTSVFPDSTRSPSPPSFAWASWLRRSTPSPAPAPSSPFRSSSRSASPRSRRTPRNRPAR